MKEISRISAFDVHPPLFSHPTGQNLRNSGTMQSKGESSGSVVTTIAISADESTALSSAASVISTVDTKTLPAIVSAAATTIEKDESEVLLQRALSLRHGLFGELKQFDEAAKLFRRSADAGNDCAI